MANQVAGPIGQLAAAEVLGHLRRIGSPVSRGHIVAVNVAKVPFAGLVSYSWFRWHRAGVEQNGREPGTQRSLGTKVNSAPRRIHVESLASLSGFSGHLIRLAKIHMATKPAIQTQKMRIGANTTNVGMALRHYSSAAAPPIPLVRQSSCR